MSCFSPRRASAVLLFALCGPTLAAQARTSVPPLTVHELFGTRDFASDLVETQWAKDGGSYTLLEDDAREHTDLYRVDAATGTRTLLVRGADLVPSGAQEPIDIESYQFSPDGARLLIFTNSARVWRQNTKGTYYVWDFGSKRLLPISRKSGYQMFAKFSPAGDRVAFVRNNNIFSTELASGTETQLTSDGSDLVINGTTDWVYEEELDLRDAFRWSPDGQRIAFWRFDQSPIQPYYLENDDPLYPAMIPVRYPKAGTPNSEVRIGVVELATGKTNWVDLGANKDIYIPGMDFADSPNEIWLTRLNRLQNQLEVLLADVRTGATRVIATDADSAWVNQHEPHWFNGGKEFLLESDRDGFTHLYLYNRNGSLSRRITSGDWDIAEFNGVDQKNRTAFVTANIDGPLVRSVVRLSLDGKGVTRVSREPGTHRAEFDPTCRYYIDYYSRAGVPTVERLHQADGSLVRSIADNKALAEKVAAQGLDLPTFLKIKAPDGAELNAWMIKPKNFDSSKHYPLLMWVYGGPGSQTVTDSWSGPYLWFQLLAQNGYLVASVDNRGTGGRGARFQRVTYLRLGQYESADQIAAARFFGSQPYVDASRIGIWGWSYGGYVASRTMFVGGDVFKAAIAVAPVTDWRFYDTIYTERYMGMPADNPQGYELSSSLAYADSLRGNFLVVHGTGDDNVHFQNTVRLVERLEKANKQFDMRIYPNKTHSISGGNTSENLFGFLTEWLKRSL
ncbi:MAG TPA: S9 family peptidase [Gemmatimonadales bacterium]|nr:S9 family peptidase [Gemmatimonadales bacterium]